MAITTFLQQLELELADKPDALAVVAQYKSALEQADAQGDKDELILLQDQMHDELAATLNAAIDSDAQQAPTLPLLVGSTSNTDQFQMWLDRLDNGALSSTEKTKLLEMAQGYDEAVQLAKSMDTTIAIKPLADVLREIRLLGTPKLKEIANFQRPMLIVTPSNAFATKISAMNTAKPYRTKGAKPQDQDDAFVWNDPASPYTPLIGTPSKVSISIVDGGTHMPHIQGIQSDSRFDARKELFKKHYQKKGMSMINAHEYAMLMQRSLNEYKRSGNDESKIVDFYKDANDTITCLDDEYLSTSPHVAYGYFSSKYRQVYCGASGADNTGANLRGRPSVQVM